MARKVPPLKLATQTETPSPSETDGANGEQRAAAASLRHSASDVGTGYDGGCCNSERG
jgi:hypothetical protein